MARDRPSPYGEGVPFFSRSAGPVPRDCWIARTILRPGGLSYKDINDFDVIRGNQQRKTKSS